MNSLEKLLLDSSCAAARVGPKMGQPRRWNSSTTPNVSGSSGPTTVTSGIQPSRKLHDGVETLEVDGDAFGIAAHSSAAGRAVQLGDARRLPELPDQSVFAATTTEDEDFHRGNSPTTAATHASIGLKSKSRVESRGVSNVCACDIE